VRAIIFDFDGVIVDSEPVHEAALREAVREAGMDLTHERYITEYVGYDDRDCYRVIAADHGRTLTGEQTRRIAARKERAVQAMLAAGRAPAWPGAVELVRAAGAAARVGLCSGARRTEIDPVLGTLGIAACFLAVVSADDVEKSKPDPACYLLTSQRLGVAPGDCTAVEDTVTGASAAREAGMRVVGVCHTVGAAALAGVAHVVVGRIGELTVGELLKA
jgi:beta-phosphoglucomutase